LKQFDEVKAHDWDSYYQIKPNPGDMLIGHLCPLPFTVMKRSLKLPGWRRKIIIQPYNESMDYAAFDDEYIDMCDISLAITGPYWFDRISKHHFFSRYMPKLRRIDLAIDLDYFPRIKTKFNPPGQRKFVYVGVDNKYKNLNYLEAIFSKLPTFEIHAIGKIRSNRKFIHHGFVDFSTDSAKELIKEFDFLITVGSNDANPTTILEAIGWGLIPICTPTSGYLDIPGIVNVPVDSLNDTASILNHLQNCPDEELEEIRKTGQQTLVKDHFWDLFYQRVYEALFSDESPAIEPRLSPLQKKYWHLWLFFLKSLILNARRFIKKFIN
jgi:hypothetical protein